MGRLRRAQSADVPAGALAETEAVEARETLAAAVPGRPHLVLGVDRGEGDLGLEEGGHVAQRDLQGLELRRIEVDLVVGGVAEVLDQGAAAGEKRASIRLPMSSR